MNNAVVITPTTGIPELADAIRSVAAQTRKVDHWIIVDGMDNAQKVLDICSAHPYGQQIIMLPENTGRPERHWLPEKKKYNGHRIYGAMGFLVNHDYVFMLDEDNWYEPHHCETMLANMETRNLDWCYSLRNIVRWNGKLAYPDDCDSLGIYPNWKGVNFVDMNCYCFTGSLFADLSTHFYGPTHTDKRIYRVCQAKTEDPSKIGSTGLFTVNYRVTDERIEKWFDKGIEEVIKQYGYNKPWRAQ